MNSLSVRTNHAVTLSDNDLDFYEKKLQPEIKRIQIAQTTGYTSPYASINLPSDPDLQQSIKAIVIDKKQLGIELLIIIGIGGSSLGLKAVYEALQGIYYNEKTESLKLYFAETVDSEALSDLLDITENMLKKGAHILINVISKSGKTTETIANYELFIRLLKKYYANTWHTYIVVTTDIDSPLWHLAQKDAISCLAIPALVGGRYSVFSAVGLFPLAMLGIDIASLQTGAQNMVLLCSSTTLKDNPAALSAALITQQYAHEIVIHDMFLFSAELTALGNWYRQLMAESLGKTATSGKRVGILPTVSIGTTDLHSVGQLYFGGPKRICTTFITIEQETPSLFLPHYQEFETLIPDIQGKPITSIMNAIISGVLATYTLENLPYMLISLPEKTAYYIGQLLQLKMIEIMYIGYLLEVNPFDQPHVERYKVETRKILAHE